MINPLLYFLLLLKATFFSSEGFANLPSIHQDLTARDWAQEADFGESIAIGQISPGPNGLWVISLGYISYGWLGALLALIAISIPPFFVLIVANIYTRIEHQRWVPGLMRGISLAVVGIFLTVFWTVLATIKGDWRGLIICAVATLLAATRKVSLPVLLILAGIVGYVIYS